MPLKGKSSVLKAVDDLTESKNNQLRAVYIKGLQNIVVGTPIDEGRARNSWFLGVGRSKAGKRSSNKNGSGSMSDIGSIPKNVLDKKLYFTNNMPYIKKLEYGGFPNPAANPQKTIGGYSDQAPRGWVRGEVLRMRKRIRAIK